MTKAFDDEAMVWLTSPINKSGLVTVQVVFRRATGSVTPIDIRPIEIFVTRIYFRWANHRNASDDMMFGTCQ